MNTFIYLIAKIKEVLKDHPGVVDVHDLHVWSISSSQDSLTCHLLIDDEASSQQILKTAIEQIVMQFSIQHTTIQVETSDFQHTEH